MTRNSYGDEYLPESAHEYYERMRRENAERMRRENAERMQHNPLPTHVLAELIEKKDAEITELKATEKILIASNVSVAESYEALITERDSDINKLLARERNIETMQAEIERLRSSLMRCIESAGTPNW